MNTITKTCLNDQPKTQSFLFSSLIIQVSSYHNIHHTEVTLVVMNTITKTCLNDQPKTQSFLYSSLIIQVSSYHNIHHTEVTLVVMNTITKTNDRCFWLPQSKEHDNSVSKTVLNITAW